MQLVQLQALFGLWHLKSACELSHVAQKKKRKRKRKKKKIGDMALSVIFDKIIERRLAITNYQEDITNNFYQIT